MPVMRSILSDVDEFEATVAIGLENCEEYIDITDFAISATEDNKTAISDYMRYYMPEYFHVAGISFVRINAQYVRLKITYDARYNTMAKYQAARRTFDAEMNNLLEGVKGNNALSEDQKALIMHDRLINYLHYDMGVYTDTVDDDSYNMCGVVFKQVAVCNGYCMAYYYLLRELGIPCEVVNSNEMMHAWNIVYIDGVPYYVDCTWDDPTYTFEGTVKHTNFLRSLAGIRETGHTADDYTTNLQINNTKYDNYYWQASTTAFQLIGNTLYYIDSQTAELKNAATGQVLCTVADRWMPDDSHYYFDNYARLCSDGASLFFNLTDSIYKYSLKTGAVTKLFTPDVSAFGTFYSIYGLRFDDSRFTCYFYNDANFDPNTVERYAVTVPYEGKLSVTVAWDSERGSVSGDGEFEENETVVLTAAPQIGYLFKGFYRGTELVSAASPYSFVVTQHTALQAQFEACSHPTNSITWTTVEATCSEDGYNLMHCNDCGYEKKQDFVDALGHNWGSWEKTKDPTCAQEGVYTRVCLRDAAHIETKAIEKTAHSPAEAAVTINEKAATCDSSGSYDRAVLCTVCGEVVRKTTYTTPALGHLWGEWQQTTAPTCAKEGVETSICARDASHRKTRQLAKIAHTPSEFAVRDNEVPATCTDYGSYDLSVYCAKCGQFLSSETFLTDPIGHSYKPVKKVAPSASTTGYTLHQCANCGDSYKTSFVSATAKIKNFKCKTRGDVKQTIVWDRVAGAKGYQIQISTKDAKKWDKYATITASVVNFSGLVAGSPYKFRVRYYFQEQEGTLGADGIVHYKTKTVYGAWQTITSPTLPKGTSLSKLSAGKKAFTAQWKKNTAAGGYQIQYSLKSNFSGAKTVTVKSNKTLKTTVKKLSAKKIYYVRVRTYKTMNKANYFSAWSKTVKVKTK